MRRLRPRSLGPQFRTVWLASTVSNFGDGIFLVALPVLAERIDPRPLPVALVFAASQLPWLVFSFVSGALVDRWDRKRVMWGTDGYRMVVVGALAVATLAGWASIPLLVVAALLLAVGEILFDNAAQSILPAVVGADRLEQANSRLFAAQFVTNNFSGGPVGGALFGLGASVPFFADAASFGISGLLLRRLPGSYRVREGGAATSLWQEAAEGLRWLWRHVLLRALALLSAVGNLASGMLAAVFVLHATQNLDVGAFGYGVLISTGGVGAIVATAVASRVSAAVPQGPLLVGAMATQGVTLVVIGLTSSPVVAGLAIALQAFVIVVWNVVVVSLRQAVAPDELLGRVNAAYQIPNRGATPLGALLGGAVGAALGVRAAMHVAGGVLLVAALASAAVVTTARIQAARLGE